MEVEVRNTLDNNGRVWHKKGNYYYYHREDGPTFIWNNGSEQWWYYNKYYESPKDMPLSLFLAYVKYNLSDIIKP